MPKAEVMKLLAGGKPDTGFFQDVAELGTLDDLNLLQERIEVEKA